MRIDEGHQFPRLVHPDVFNDDTSLRLLVYRRLTESGLPASSVRSAFSDLSSFSTRCTTTHRLTSSTLCGPHQEPHLRQYNAWGRRVDELVTGQGWKDLKRAAAEEGIVTTSYGPARQEWGSAARVLAFTRVLLFGPVSKLALCPMSMTDGAARVLELVGTPSQQAEVLPRLVSNEAEKAWTAGQWMTERPGGSDVSRTETVARHVEGRTYALDGFKWFSSATDGDVALALARTNDVAGSRGLSLFLVRLRDSEDAHVPLNNGVRVHRLKHKLGSKYLPTAELELRDCHAELVGEVGQGVKTIASVLNITRLYSASGAVGGLLYGWRLSAHYATQRQVGDKMLSDLPLHTRSLFGIAVTQRALQQLFYSVVSLLGKSECNIASREEDTLLRLLTPTLKAFVSTRGTEAVLGLVDSFGGQGYMEDSGLGVAEMLRDLTVERIWEGTAEVMSMDVVRVLSAVKGEALTVLLDDVERRVRGDVVVGELQEIVKRLKEHVATTRRACEALASHGAKASHRYARPLLDVIALLYSSALLVDHAGWSRKHAGDDEDVVVARAWVEEIGGIEAAMDAFRRALRDIEAEHNERAVVFGAKL
ncbi:acyl-CoA dehydrogenase NM domain-like protein [Jaminaea rosea]|uniref:Acyl-CoA dehydrogenase NM domain-like protein n=1 Tax=Jaminaea rosea TaxID=1569628 RepID=A0A316UQE6_9BASI|nr:acyl-CoA dehydrogenase NM domain-like protein [Jaminaea rosea]PWN27529.1 acyl-CoA dehydrogenase NM domain-like protein [Jaminaea rosea]